eukprot:TRINITY_DN36479_c0_g1_i1.p2 TRINITY_DN36479_c0_g1~~TRINITY_DN36479_c0_g1_i1.p2  ORF type:complete len:513 (+),score=145.20 TRINITY_DN36479_c0_g1_i1:94-1632(+)
MQSSPVLRFSSTLFMAARNQNWPRALKVFAVEAPVFAKHRAQKAADASRAIVVALQKDSQWFRALGFIAAASALAVRPDGVALTAAATACTSAKKWRVSCALLAAGSRQRVDVQALTRVTCHAVAKAQSWQRGLGLLGALPRQRAEFTTESRVRAVQTAAGAAAWRCALRAVRGGDLDPTLCSSALAALRPPPATASESAPSGLWRVALGLWQGLTQRRCRADGPSCGAAVAAAARAATASARSEERLSCGAWEAALRVIARTRELRIALTPAAVQSAFSACRSNGRTAAGAALLALPETPQCPELRRLAITVTAAEGGSWCAALGRLQALRLRRFAADARATSAALEHCAEALAWGGALGLLRSCRRHRAGADAATVTAAVSVCTRAGRWEVALLAHAAWQDVAAGDVVALGAAADACSKGQLWRAAVSCIAAAGEGATDATLGAAARACGAAAEWAVALRVALRRPKCSVAAGEAASACAARRQWRHALGLLEVSRLSSSTAWPWRFPTE